MITRINPPIPLYTSKGAGVAHFVINYGFEMGLFWVVFLDETGEIWIQENSDVRAQEHYTWGRGKHEVDSNK